ncbi:MAG TPA: ArsR family transcriptional regulator [Marmoricola sp.]|jgi:protein-tyrosine-phosphatase/DNA-binding transcriptional ArsR family regulator
MSPAPGSSTTAVVPEFLRLTGHPIRWDVLSQLARSDRRVRELTALVGQRQNLTSYHLRRLRDAGLVTMRRSSADKREAYYSLDLAACRAGMTDAGAALHPGLRLVPADLRTRLVGGRVGSPARVLFLCTGNSSRSQMAEALLEQLGGTTVDVVSAGSHPKPVHPNAVRVMRERGLDIRDRRSKHVQEFAGRRFDLVISLCDRVREVCPDFPGAPVVAHWSLADPAADGTDDERSYPAFVRTADELSMRVDFLMSAIVHTLTSKEVTRHDRRPR